VFESKALRKIFGLKKNGVIGQFRILLNEELNILCRPTVECGSLLGSCTV
jgi:hypothetical protein